MEFTESMALADRKGDTRTQRAVERNFEIIGELLKRLNLTDPEIARHIPQAGRIASFRNLLAHEYQRADPEIVWNIATVHLPQLRRIVENLLAERAPIDPEPESEADSFTSHGPGY